MLRGKFVLIDNILQHDLGWKYFVCRDLDTGDLTNANAHELDIVTVVNMDLDEDIAMPSTAPPTLPAMSTPAFYPSDITPAAKNGRFVECTNEELDAIAKSRTAESTDSQTKWAVHLTKGKSF